MSARRRGRVSRPGVATGRSIEEAFWIMGVAMGNGGAMRVAPCFQ
jgi:hypothetical protein